MLVIRKAEAADVPAIHRLVKALAVYEKEPDAVEATEADFLRDGFGDRPHFEVLVAQESEGAPVFGFALYFFGYTTWRGTRTLYLEDLFVEPEHRGEGAGIALMKELARVAVANDCRKFVWQVLDWNAPAIAFYERLGAVVLKPWLTVRIDGEALTRLAC